MSKKYKLTDEVNELGLHRIVALRDIPRHNVKKGDLGGFIESEENLSQKGDAWVGDNAEVFGYAQVYGDACVFGNAHVFGNSRVEGEAQISGHAKIFGDACVSGHAYAYENALIYCNACVSGDARIYGNAHVFGYAKVYGNAIVCDNSWVSGNAIVCKNAEVYGVAEICGEAVISRKSDYITFQIWWDNNKSVTWTRSNNMWKVGCFYGTGEGLLTKVEKEDKLSLREYKRIVNYVESILKDEISTKKKTIHRDSKGRFCKCK